MKKYWNIGTKTITLLIVLTFSYACQTQPTKDQSYDINISNISGRLRTMINNKEKQSISIVNFQNFEGENEPLGEFFAEEISTYIINEYAKFNIVDRSKLNTLIKEQGLKENGLLDKKTVGKIGKFIGIDAMITGKYEILDSVRVKVWIKVIDIENAQILGTEESIFTRGSLIDKFIKKNEKMKKK